ncbi:MAG: hypothetical protein J0H24_21305, partial [Delftia acidovorans]|nr:hypothetical protein [Delftia acidovorans]
MILVRSGNSGTIESGDYDVLRSGGASRRALPFVMQYELTYIAVFLNDWRISGFVIPCLRANCSTSVVSKRVVWIKSRASALVFKNLAMGRIPKSHFSNRSGI